MGQELAESAAVARPGLTSEQLQRLHRDGFVVVHGVVSEELLNQMREEFQRAWEAASTERQFRMRILAYPAFLRLFDDPSLLAVPRSIFGTWLQFLDYHLIYQPPHSHWAEGPDAPRTERDWHRDFTHVIPEMAAPLMVTAITFLDGVTETMGPTVVLPGTHRSPAWAVVMHASDPHPEEVPVPMDTGDLLLLNSTIVHSRGRNHSQQDRRGVVMNFGYWWMKQWDNDISLPPEALRDAPPERLRLLGELQPYEDLYIEDL